VSGVKNGGAGRGIRFALLAHGSSDARHIRGAQALAASVSRLLGEEVGCAFLSDEQSDERLPEGARVLPLFLGLGRHARVDAPALAAKSGAHLLPPLAERAEAVAELAWARVTADAGGGSGARRRKVNAMFGLHRFAGFEALYAALHARNARARLTAQTALHAEPSIASVLALWRAEGVAPIRFQPMALFPGRSLDAMARAAAGEDVEMLPPLAESEGFVELIAGLLRIS